MLVREYHFGLVCARLFGCHEGIGHDDDFVAHLEFSGGGTIEADAATAALASDNVSFDALSVAIVDHVHMFAGQKSGGLHQVFIDGDASHVVEVGLRYVGAVYF